MIRVIGKNLQLGKMYAVEKLSSYITRGVYTVSGPFHPFGGAVDIIIVQQQDGSFKSSPWYVRFGKFQGVLKTTEKVVTICVNGVETVSHMYLDHKGEAYFLKDSDSGEGVDFEISPPSPGDEMNDKIRSARFKKVSCNYDGGQGEPISHLDNGNAKIMSRTSSRHSRIFGSKSIKGNDQGSNVERVSSLERAEIVADLLETKWLTNLSPNEHRSDISTEKDDFDVTNIKNEMVSSHEEGTCDNVGTSIGSREHFEEVAIHNSLNATNCIGDNPNPWLITDDSVKESVGSDGEKLGDSLRTNVAREVHFGETITETSSSRTPEEVLEVYTLESGDSGDRSKLVSESGMIESDEYNISSQGSILDTFTDDAQIPGPMADEPPTVTLPEEKYDEEKEASSLSYTERLQSPTVTFDLSAQPQDTLSLSSGGRESMQEHICEVTSIPESEKSIDREKCGGCHNQDLELSRVEVSSVFQDYQSHSPSNVTFQDTSGNVCNADSPQNLSSSESEVIYPDRETSVLSEGKLSRIEELDFNQNRCSVLGEEASTPNCHVPVPNNISFISNEGQESKTLGNCFSGEKPYLQSGLKFAQDESKFPLSESSEHEQFQFSDIDSFSVKQIDSEVQVSNTASETEDSTLLKIEGDIEEEEQDSEDTKHEECFGSDSEVSGSQTSPLAIPRSTMQLGDTVPSAKSLPIIRSQIHDFERSNLLYPLSSSLDLNSDKFEHDLVKKEISNSSKTESVFGSDVIQDNCASQAPATGVGSEDKQGHNVIPINSSVEQSLCKHLLFEGMGADAASRVFETDKEQIFESQGMIDVGKDEKSGDPSGAITPSGGSWRLWPFSLKNSKTINTMRSVPMNTTDQENVDAAPMRSQSLVGHDDVQKAKFKKKKVQSLTPTSEELASLNLKEGRNVVTFSFSTAMLGQQQVDARIYLWKWNTRIVISDVDGTITKSDVLGQFMPLVGKDWSQTGVTHLFSAIKENGYQLLFLSARAISQAYLTRQFLFNLKQDGKALPDGPVVISPDGLFPSLYREVIRRAPHEFKISCLEDIRTLFPTECNPFYAGFGNRYTDEISYLKVGVPKGKIFIINPKGEVAVNHRVDTKSYTSLHALVNAMFPPISTAEQEDFNSWNYWRLPPPDVNI